MDAIFELESLDAIIQVSKDILKTLYDTNHVSSADLEAHTIQIAKEDIKKLIYNNNYDMEKVAEIMNSKGWDQDKVNCFTSILEERKTELLYRALLHHNCSYGETLIDFNWVLNLIFGTNNLKNLRYPLLQLFLSTVNSTGQHQEHVYDINKDMLAKIINCLENIEET